MQFRSHSITTGTLSRWSSSRLSTFSSGHFASPSRTAYRDFGIARLGIREVISNKCDCARSVAVGMVHQRRNASGPSGTNTGGSSQPISKTSTAQSSSEEKGATSHSHDDHSHDGHSHGLFHSHSHDSAEGAGQIIAALQGHAKDKGSRITLIGLASNVGLTGMKAVAGVMMNSASLLAEAGHSLSDLLGDFVTLACWKVSRRPPSDTYPWGYGKFETFGTLSVSIILVGGAIGIGLHSYHLLLQSLLPWLATLDPSSPFSQLGAYLPSSVPSPLLELFHSHGPSALEDHAHGAHSHGVDAEAQLLNPHAAWFALASVIIKEWLYRATKKVADEEHSPVLHANALHHRSDALTSGVALASILGSAMGATVLDPLGGLAVSFFILQQGLGLSRTAFLELLDKGIDEKTRGAIESSVEPLIDGEKLLSIRNVRGVKSGGLSFVDLTISVPPSMSVREAHDVESKVREAVMTARREVRELKVHVHSYEEGEEHPVVEMNGKDRVVRSDFGRDGC